MARIGWGGGRSTGGEHRMRDEHRMREGRVRGYRVRGGRRLLAVAAVVVTATALTVTRASAAVPPYLDPTQPVPVRVADLLGRMSLDEKIGQMTQAERLAVN